jgi:hypothetical protein
MRTCLLMLFIALSLSAFGQSGGLSAQNTATPPRKCPDP